MKDRTKEIISRLTKLEEVVFGDKSQTDGKKLARGRKTKLDFSLNKRAFMKRYFLKLNGQETFTLICSFLSKGDPSVLVDLSTVRETWKDCKGIIGYPYGSIYSTRAKENGWVDTPDDTRATYRLGKQWNEILRKHD